MFYESTHVDDISIIWHKAMKQNITYLFWLKFYFSRLLLSLLFILEQ